MTNEEYEDYLAKRAKRAKRQARRVITGVVLAGILMVTSVTIGVALTKSIMCASRWDGTYQTEYHLISGCRVNVNGKWFPEANARIFQ